MGQFYFEEALFTDPREATRDHFKAMVVYNARSLVISTLKQRQRIRGMGHAMAAPSASWDSVSQPL